MDKMKIYSRTPLPKPHRSEMYQCLCNGTVISWLRRWSDVGQSCASLEGTDPAPTFDTRGTSSRIDMAFGNPEAVRLFKTYEVLDVPSHGIKSHKLVKVVLDVKCPKSCAWQTRQIKMLPVPEEALCKEDTCALEDVLDRYIDSCP